MYPSTRTGPSDLRLHWDRGRGFWPQSAIWSHTARTMWGMCGITIMERNGCPLVMWTSSVNVRLFVLLISYCVHRFDEFSLFQVKDTTSLLENFDLLFQSCLSLKTEIASSVSPVSAQFEFEVFYHYSESYMNIYRCVISCCCSSIHHASQYEHDRHNQWTSACRWGHRCKHIPGQHTDWPQWVLMTINLHIFSISSLVDYYFSLKLGQQIVDDSRWWSYCCLRKSM